MRKWIYAIFAVVLGIGLAVPFDAEARRFGGARSIGTQRQALPDKPVTPPAATPAQQAAPGAAAAGAAAKPGMSRWLGPIAGIAAALGLAWLLGDQLGSFVLMLLVGLAVAMVVMVLMRRFGKPQPQGAAARMQYAGVGSETVAAPPPSQATGGATVPSFGSQFTPRIPAGFNVDGFVREAKRSFLALQAANDRGDAGSIRDFVTDEMYQHVKRDIEERGGSGQSTDVVTLNADLLEVVTEGGVHWASLRFSGLIREDANATPQPFEEVWNLQKSPDSGWLLAGIQQVS
jgi:predicted lipid-binding transport protein (Tim44 family)